MPTNWIVPVVEDLQAYLQAAIVGASTLTGAANETGSTGIQRAEKVLGYTVAQVRGAILTAGRVPLSLTEGAVPPEGVGHTLILTIDAMVGAVPKLSEFVESDSFKRRLTAANDWLKAVQDGQSVTSPSDPPTDTTLLPRGTQWGDLQGTSEAGTAGRYDMTSDGYA